MGIGVKEEVIVSKITNALMIINVLEEEPVETKNVLINVLLPTVEVKFASKVYVNNVLVILIARIILSVKIINVLIDALSFNVN